MTYCLGILLPSGLVLAADSLSNAGVDHVARVSKLAVVARPGDRVIAILSAGNLATSQSVVTQLTESMGGGPAGQDLQAARTMTEVAAMVGAKLREVVDRDRRYVEPYGDPNANFLVGGQIIGEPPRLFEIYAAGNFIEASRRSCYLQIGETKYGKPILDRALRGDSALDQAAKLALLSFDATIRSNVSVGLPIDILIYEADSFSAANMASLDDDNSYWRDLREAYSEGLSALVESLPPPPKSWQSNARASQ